jgi:hypothetical protein
MKSGFFYNQEKNGITKVQIIEKAHHFAKLKLQTKTGMIGVLLYIKG